MKTVEFITSRPSVMKSLDPSVEPEPGKGKVLTTVAVYAC